MRKIQNFLGPIYSYPKKVLDFSHFGEILDLFRDGNLLFVSTVAIDKLKSLFTLSQFMSDIRRLVPTKAISKSLNLMFCFHLQIFQVLSVLNVNNGRYVDI